MAIAIRLPLPESMTKRTVHHDIDESETPGMVLELVKQAVNCGA
jgi:hypothetical protein